jgi:hypothetical protein
MALDSKESITNPSTKVTEKDSPFSPASRLSCLPETAALVKNDSADGKVAPISSIYRKKPTPTAKFSDTISLETSKPSIPPSPLSFTNTETKEVVKAPTSIKRKTPHIAKAVEQTVHKRNKAINPDNSSTLRPEMIKEKHHRQASPAAPSKIQAPEPIRQFNLKLYNEETKQGHFERDKKSCIWMVESDGTYNDCSRKVKIGADNYCERHEISVKLSRKNIVDFLSKFAPIQSKARDEYTIDELLGKGYVLIINCFRAFGSVYQVHHNKTKELFARKTVKFNYASKIIVDPKNEIIMLQKVKHLECCITLIEAYTYPDELEMRIIMDLGIPLTSLLNYYSLKNKKIELMHANTMMYQSACGIHTLCINGVVHNDIKPENYSVHYTRRDRAELKLLDFGLAQQLKEGETNSQMIAGGTGRFMSPESTKIAGCHKRDVWAVGITAIDILNVGCDVSCGNETTEKPGAVPKIRRELKDGSMLDILIKSALVHDVSKRATAAQLVNVFFNAILISRL